MKQKKSRTTGNENTVYNFWCTGGDIAMNMTNRYLKQDYYIPEK